MVRSQAASHSSHGRALHSCPLACLSSVCLQAHVYRLVQQAGVTFVSVGHRSSLLQYHSQLLTVQPPSSAVMPDWKEGRTGGREEGMQGDTGQSRNNKLLTWRLEKISHEAD